jgi:hypothetical protein
MLCYAVYLLCCLIVIAKYFLIDSQISANSQSCRGNAIISSIYLPPITLMVMVMAMVMMMLVV